MPSSLGERLSQYHRVQELTLWMLESAQTADWERVSAIEEERNRLAQILLSTSLPDEIHQALAETLSATLSMSQEIHAITERARDATANEIREFRRRKRAGAAYNSMG